MGQFNSSGSYPAFLQPTANKELYTGNYLNFTDSNHQQWAQQFMPDLYKKIAPKYGSNQTIAGFLKMITNGEMSANSDQIIWQEEGRLHTRYEKLWADSDSADPTATAITPATNSSTITAGEAFLTFTLGQNQAGPGQHLTTGSDSKFGPLEQQNPFNPGTALNYQQPSINFRVGQTVMVQKEGTTEAVIKGVVIQVTGTSFVMGVYDTATVVASSAGDEFTALVYGSEFGKGTGNFIDKVDSEYSTYANQLIILKEHYSINGTDLSQIGWIDTGEGYLWFHKSKSDNMKRWNDYMEMALVEGVTKGAGAAVSLPTGLGDYRDENSGSAVNYSSTGINSNARGTQGFFQALEERGNVYQGFGDEAAGGGALTDFDNVLKQLDKQGSIEENMIYTDRDLSLEIDDILAQQNSYGAGGTSWGAFNNSEKMALDLGFSGFRRGSYDFYKTDWRYLNDHATRGGFNDIEGVLIPAGTSTVYEKFGNGKVKRPFLHVRYREGRQMKNWITGGAGGATTSDIDEVRHHYLTERCLITQAANNFVLFKK